MEVFKIGYVAMMAIHFILVTFALQHTTKPNVSTKIIHVYKPLIKYRLIFLEIL